jgi:hypothetical protein
MEPKIFWVPPCGARAKESLLSLKVLILMGDWCSEDRNQETKEITAKVGMLVI